MAISPKRRTDWTRYGGAVAVIVLAALLRFELEEPLAGGGFMIFFVAVIVASWFGGLGPSLLALGLSLAVSVWFFARPPDEPPEPAARMWAGLAIFFFTGLSTALLSESVRAARRRAETADRRKDEFLAILAHELRNPLAPITAALDIVRHPAVDEATVHWAHELIERQVRHLVRLVDDLLDVSRVARNKIELRNEFVELQTVVEGAVETARGLIECQQHELTIELPDQPTTLFVDPVRLSQAIANLLNNSARYTPPGGKIRLSGELVGASVEIRVADTGVGIAPEMLPKLFELFTQAHAADGAQGGLGIGLALVKSLVELMGGSVEARSEGLGKGSEFVIRLPLAPVESKPAGGKLLPPAAAAVPKRRVFVVDDNADAARTLADLLRLEGHDVKTFYNGRAALSAAETARPDVVLLDLGMPEMDGLELARRLRAIRGMAPALLIAVTGWGQPCDRERTRAAGIDHHLVKPVDAATLRGLLSGSTVGDTPLSIASAAD